MGSEKQQQEVNKAIQELEELDILAEQPVIIGQFRDRKIGVYPASLARYKTVAKLIYESDSQIFDLRQKLIFGEAEKMSPEEQKALQDECEASLDRQIDDLAPIVAEMLKRPTGKYQWDEPSLNLEEIRNCISGRTIIKVIDMWLRLSSIPVALKKVTMIGH